MANMVRIDTEVLRKLKKFAESTGRSMKHMVSEQMRKFLKNKDWGKGSNLKD